MIAEHKLTTTQHELIVTNFNDSKLGFIKILKEYTGERLKECKWVADLLPRDKYFEYRADITKEGHLKYLNDNSKLNCSINGNELIVKFYMDTSKTERLRYDLQEWNIVFELKGLKEFREEKLKNILDD
jgi:hypothetical protein